MRNFRHFFYFLLFGILLVSCRSSPDTAEIAEDYAEDYIEVTDSDTTQIDLPDIIVTPYIPIFDMPDPPVLPLPEFNFTRPDQIALAEPIIPEPLLPEPVLPEPELPELPLMQEDVPIETQLPIQEDEALDASVPETIVEELQEDPQPEEPLPPPPPPPLPPVNIAPAEPPPLITPPVISEPLPVDPFPVPANPIPEPLGEEINFSRVVRATVGQIIEIPFRGTGWVFLGELANRRGIRYEARRLDVQEAFTEGQSFIFLCEAVGTYILRFYRQDFYQDYLINDYVQVIVGESSAGTTLNRIIAEPRWPPLAEPPALSVTPAAPSLPSLPDSLPVDSLPMDSMSLDSIPPDSVSSDFIPPSPDHVSQPGTLEFEAEGLAEEAQVLPMLSITEYILRARQEFDAGRIREAINILDTMRQFYPQGSDEAWWLYGQLYEANSPSRDILLSLEYYNRLVSEYPLSSRVLDAQRRIAYLERFFLNIR